MTKDLFAHNLFIHSSSNPCHLSLKVNVVQKPHLKSSKKKDEASAAAIFSLLPSSCKFLRFLSQWNAHEECYYAIWEEGNGNCDDKTENLLPQSSFKFGYFIAYHILPLVLLFCLFPFLNSFYFTLLNSLKPRLFINPVLNNPNN